MPAVQAAADLWLHQLAGSLSNRGRLYSPKTVRGYTYHINAFAAWCGSRTVLEIDAALVGEHFRALRQQGLAAHTIARRDEALRVWLGWLTERGLLPRQPLARTRRTKAGDTPVQTFSESEIAALLGACDRGFWAGTRDAAMILTLLRTGVRASELVDLDLADYDAAAATLTVRHGKGDKRRVVGVPHDLAAAISDWLIAARGELPGPLYPSERRTGKGTGRLRADSVNRVLTRLARRGRVEHVHPHRFRHSFAVQFVEDGGDPVTLMRLLGHATLTMTTKYLRAYEEEQAAQEHVRVMQGRRRR